jgi:formiminotetrahydrofolate cyclodeaminase
VPLEVLEKSVEAARLARAAATMGNKNSLSDAGVAGLAAQTAGEGAYYNVLINLGGIKDAKFIGGVRRRATALRKDLDRAARAVRGLVSKALVSPR